MAGSVWVLVEDELACDHLSAGASRSLWRRRDELLDVLCRVADGVVCADEGASPRAELLSTDAVED